MYSLIGGPALLHVVHDELIVQQRRVLDAARHARAHWEGQLRLARQRGVARLRKIFQK